MTKVSTQHVIAQRIATELKDGELVNLGMGLPTLVAEYIPAEVKLVLHSENGLVGLGPVLPALTYADRAQVVNSGGQPAEVVTGAAFFDSSLSFGLIRGGHLDVTVLEALQVDQTGSVASHLIPNQLLPGMGGAMDLLVGSKKVIIGMSQLSGTHKKMVKACTLPLTGRQVVDLIVTEMGVFQPVGSGFLLKEINPFFTFAEIQAATAGELIVPADVM